MIIQGRSSVGSVGDRALNYQLNIRGFELRKKKENELKQIYSQ